MKLAILFAVDFVATVAFFAHVMHKDGTLRRRK